MASFCDDSHRFNFFKDIAGPRQAFVVEDMEVGVLEWTEGPLPNAVHIQPIRKMSVVDLFARSEPRLRVIFSPLDEPTYETVAGLVQLFRHYSIPSDFLSERIQSVTHSFGSEKDSNNWNCSWFHFLCKNVTVRLFEGLDSQIVNPHHDSLPQSQADWSWIRAGFFLKWLPSQGPNSSNQSCVTLICFGASIQLQQRFERLASNSAWRDAVSDPYNLFVIILDELFLQMDGIVWNLSDTFRSIEERTLDRAHSRDPTDEMDFVGLHNVAKHIIFLKEGSDAILLTLENMLAHHKHLLETGSSSGADAREATQVRLKYKDGLFQSVSLRVTSLDKRMQNIINLSFNLATQQDSRVVQRDSFSMKTIAAVTLFFLPISTTATIFGSQFFDFDSTTGHIRVSTTFWLFWVISIPLTTIVLTLWYLYHGRAVRRLKPSAKRLPDSERTLASS